MAYILTVAFQATLHATTSWTAAEIAAHTAAALSPQLPPALQRHRRIVSDAQCLHDARLAARQTLDFDAVPKRPAIYRDDDLIQLTASE